MSIVESHLLPEHRRGGFLTQAGLLAMNSDGKDSHPLKRESGCSKSCSTIHHHLLRRLFLASILQIRDCQLTLKERLANHRDQAACRSCHSKIDPWGIAFENLMPSATGGQRFMVSVRDASSLLYNSQELKVVEGLKIYLLEHRQDQFHSGPGA